MKNPPKCDQTLTVSLFHLKMLQKRNIFFYHINVISLHEYIHFRFTFLDTTGMVRTFN